jgi:CDP-diacylglycerol---serine O-phosphatidyltransferase
MKDFTKLESQSSQQSRQESSQQLRQQLGHSLDLRSASTIAKSYGQIFDLANSVTLLGLGCGLMAIAAATQSDRGAMLGLMAAGCLDGLDGWIARRQNRTQWQRAIGAQLDSFVDLCCFGWAPLLILVLLGFQQSFDYLIMTLYLFCAVLRLTIFNCVGLQVIQQRQYFIGLPITSISLILPLGWLIAQMTLAPELRERCLIDLIGLVAILMIAPMRVPKPTGKMAQLIAVIFLLVALAYLMG